MVKNQKTKVKNKVRNKNGRPLNCKKCNKRKRPKGNAFKNKEGYCECGRPTVLTKEVIQKLEDVFSISGTDGEACLYAGIGMSTLYNYQQENPEFQERKLILKKTVNLKARKTLAKDVAETSGARYWAEKKMKSEFGESVPVNNININFSDEADKRAKKYED